MPDWTHREIQRWSEGHGTLPPPWVAYPDTHPYSLFWRMGGGEDFIMAWSAWWDAQGLDEVERLAYFRRFPAPPRWLEWTILALWALDDGLDLSPYFERAEALGLGTRAAHEQDLDDPRWRDGG